MAYNLLYYNSGNGELVEADDAAIDEISEFVLETMANGSYNGTITLGTTNPIGTFTDTVRQGGIGSNDINILSNEYTLSQIDTVTQTQDPPQYLGYVVEGSTVVIQEEDETTLDDLADEILQRLIDDGPNSYYLGEFSPSDGGTWVSVGTILDTFEGFGVTNTTYQLWHKITSDTYTGVSKRPLKLDASNQLRSFTDSEINDIIKKVEERISATGIGTYALQSTVPSTGTWVNQGSITDIRRNTEPATYVGDGGYAGTFTRDNLTFTSISDQRFTRQFTGEFTGDARYIALEEYLTSGQYFGKDGNNYIGNNTYLGLAYYTGLEFFTRVSRTEYYTREYTGIFVGSRNYVGTYQGPTNYAGAIVDNSTSNINSVTLWKRIS